MPGPSCGNVGDGFSTCGCVPQSGHPMETLETESPTFDACLPAEAQGSAANSMETRTNSRLIEFPGVSRSSVPGWRKEITERVREVQERRAREAAAEAASLELAADSDSARSTPQLELLPQAGTPVVNPLVTAALKRIERAHVEPAPVFVQANRPDQLATLAYAVNENFEGSSSAEMPAMAVGEITNATHDEMELHSEEAVEPNKTHNLVVVPPPKTAVSEGETIKTRPRRVIGEDPNSPALNYLDSIETTIHIENPSNRAPTPRRVVASVVDLLVVGLLCSPFAAGVVLMEANWRDPQVLALFVSIVVLVKFLYSTIATALTGRTLGMRLLQLRVVDARTGLIPTGKQSAGRALIYLASLFSAGLALTYALVDREKRTAHDRFTQTAVIRA